MLLARLVECRVPLVRSTWSIVSATTRRSHPGLKDYHDGPDEDPSATDNRVNRATLADSACAALPCGVLNAQCSVARCPHSLEIGQFRAKAIVSAYDPLDGMGWSPLRLLEKQAGGRGPAVPCAFVLCGWIIAARDPLSRVQRQAI